MVLLIVVSVALLIWGFSKGFGGNAVDVLLYWTYIMLGLALFSVIIIGLIVSTKNNPKSLIRLGIILLGVAAVCLVAYLLAKGDPAVAYNGPAVSGSTLKLTDTVLNLTYIAGAGAILAIIVGEIRMAIASKK
jgi:peptidoglycan/LPS O-acetylase OafA/YrhL